MNSIKHGSASAVRLVAMALTILCSSIQAQEPARRGAENPDHPCQPIYTDHYGPYDYRTHRKELAIVEQFHFTRKVEMLREGQSGWIGGDINYTLRASPNHHRALIAIVRWTELNKSDTTQGQGLPVECYFDRAIRFRPDDTIVRALYAQFLHKRKREEEAFRQLEIGVRFASENAISLHNLGMVYFELGNPDKALELAHKSAQLGYTRTTLKDLLVKAGKWRNPEPN